jgi:hypothetical protein
VKEWITEYEDMAPSGSTPLPLLQPQQVTDGIFHNFVKLPSMMTATVNLNNSSKNKEEDVQTMINNENKKKKENKDGTTIKASAHFIHQQKVRVSQSIDIGVRVTSVKRRVAGSLSIKSSGGAKNQKNNIEGSISINATTTYAAKSRKDLSNHDKKKKSQIYHNHHDVLYDGSVEVDVVGDGGEDRQWTMMNSQNEVVGVDSVIDAAAADATSAVVVLPCLISKLSTTPTPTSQVKELILGRVQDEDMTPHLIERGLLHPHRQKRERKR